MEDREIIALYHARSEEAIARTDEQYGDYCRSIAMRILHNELDAEECVSDTYWHAWNAIPPQSPACLRLFLGRITRNLSLGVFAKQHTKKRGEGQLPLMLDELVECVPTKENGDTQTDTIVIRDTVNRFLGQLPPRERWLFLRRYWYADSIGELAQAANMQDNHVRVMLCRARKKLKSALEKEGIAL